MIENPAQGHGEALPALEPGELRSLIDELEDSIIEVKAAHCVLDILINDTLSDLDRDPRLRDALACSCGVLETRLEILQEHYTHLHRVVRGAGIAD